MQPLLKKQASFDVNEVRKDFPILQTSVRGKPLVYLDNGASTQKPKYVLDRLQKFYSEEYANVHRGVHHLSQIATDAYEGARKTIQNFLGAASEKEIIFVRGATEGINLIAATFGQTLKAGDEILISAMEHHSNIVPWQILRDRIGITLKVIPMNSKGELLMDEFHKLLSPKTKLVSVVHVSNALGTINPVEEIIEAAHKVGAKVLLDGAQAASHFPVHVQKFDVDFYVLSGHKLFAPTGIGILYGKQKILETLPPYQGGGDMIASVTFEKTTYNELPYKFEAGTPHIEGAIGLAAAIEYLQTLDWEGLEKHEAELLEHATRELKKIPKVQFVGEAKNKASVVAFTLDGIHPHDIATFLDQDGVAVRAGHHCAQPVMDFFKVPATIRASFAFYNTKQEVDVLVNSLKKVLEFFK